MNYYKNFSLEQGKFCILSNLRNYIQYYKLEVSEAWLGGIMGYMGFFYTDLTIPTNEVVHGRSGDFEYLFQCFQGQLENPLEERIIGIDNIAYSLREMLTKYGIALIWINDFYLEYSSYYKLGEFWSLAVLLEIEDSKVVIFDNGLKELDINVFKEAAKQKGSIRFYHVPECGLGWSCSEKDAVLKGLNWIINRLEDNKDHGNRYYGICAIEHFMKDLKVPDDKDETYNLYFQMNRPGGITLTRDNMKKLCTHLEEKGISDKTKQCRDVYENLSEYWRKIASLLFRLSNCEDIDLRERIVNRVSEALEYEKLGLAALKVLTGDLKGGK